LITPAALARHPTVRRQTRGSRKLPGRREFRRQVALELIPYDLVLMDVQMPVMDGLEATKRIRDPQSTAPNHGIPIVAMTAQAMQSDRDKCLQAGMNDYVSKPVAPLVLAEVLMKWLPKESAQPPSLVFDRAGLLERVMGDAHLAASVLAEFLTDIPLRIQALMESLDDGNDSVAERLAHTIKGASANVGGEAMRVLAGQMEGAAKAGDLAAVRARMPELGTQFDRLREAIKASVHIPGIRADGVRAGPQDGIQ
jgi:CheY-like chemotaxis protein/HPt (histidine-containing phosphotransfer) domain-containing protein